MLRRVLVIGGLLGLCAGAGFGAEGAAQMEYFGAQSMISPLKTVLVRRPDAAFSVTEPERWHYTARPDLFKAQREHDAFVDILRKEGVEVVYHDEKMKGKADAIFVHDPVIITARGAVILRMGKTLRRGEEEAIEAKLHSIGVPTMYAVGGHGTAEAGDILWVDENTVAIGQSYRTNANGIVQLRKALDAIGVRVITVQLPHGPGEEACLHLQTLISIVDEKTALVYLPLLPVPFVQYLQKRGFKLIEVPEKEFATMGPNVLAIRPGVCVALAGNPITKSRLELEGIKVHTYRGEEISLKAEGGPTCLTRPLLREDEA